MPKNGRVDKYIFKNNVQDLFKLLHFLLTFATSSVDKEKTAPIKEGQTVTELPQTGDAATEKTTFVGAMLATLAGLLGFVTTKRKKEDK